MWEDFAHAVCQLTSFRFREVSHSTRIKTARPNRLMARFSRVLSADSGLAIAPIIMTAITRRAPAGTRIFSGIRLQIRTPVLSQTQCIGFVTTVIGICNVIIRIAMHRQNRNGIIQFLSFRWSTRDAIHQPVKSSSMNRWTKIRYFL